MLCEYGGGGGGGGGGDGSRISLLIDRTHRFVLR